MRGAEAFLIPLNWRESLKGETAVWLSAGRKADKFQSHQGMTPHFKVQSLLCVTPFDYDDLDD